ncbi:MAG TPA: YoaK family protein [Silvibacterium sp.]|nr:YoaK family protein [Silvibacterium sp.]
MRTTERDVLLVLLAVASGSADGWSYLGLGHAFVANMTGNTVLTGLAVFEPRGELVHPILALCLYAVGAVAGSAFARKVHQGVVWARAITLVLLLEALILLAAEAGWIAIRRSSPGNSPLPIEILLGCVAFAVGLQSGAMLQLKIPGIVTTYITGTWTTLMSGLAHFIAEEKSETPRERLRFEERLLMQASILSAYLLSAVLTGWLFFHHPLVVGAIPASSVSIVVVYAVLRTDIVARPK